MNRSMRLSPVILGLSGSLAWAQLDAGALNEAYKEFDRQRNDGLGHSTSSDSGTLGWGEGSIIQSYANMWEATRDTYWLGKIRQHFRNIMATATDPDGDGFKSWQTPTYSTALAFAERLHNVGTATISPERQKEFNGKKANTVTGDTYVIEFQEDADTYRIRDLDTHEILVERHAYTSGAKSTAIVPFRFTITGETHQGDRFLIRTQAPLPATFTVHKGMFVYPAALFIEAVNSRAALRAEFGADADVFLQFVNQHIFEKNEMDWLDMGEQGGGYRFEPFITDRYPNRIMPHNQFAALCRAWLVLKDVKGAHPLMGERAEQMVRYLRHHMHLFEKKEGGEPWEWYQWHYWDWTDYGKPGNSGWEDTSHAGLTLTLAVVAARRGVIFNDRDMGRIANCSLRVMWNGDPEKPKMAARVDGSGKHTFSALNGNWGQLGQWNALAAELALREFQALDPKKQAAVAPTMLLIAKRAGMLPD